MVLTGAPPVLDTMNSEDGTVCSGSCGGGSDSRNFNIRNSQQYAVQVALVTMKERCQKLQERLICLERENASLKASTISSEGSRSSNSTVEAQLRDKVAQLQSQKSHLTHQIFIVASENKQLFDRLSRLTEANRSLGGHLSRISSTLSKHESVPVEVAAPSPTRTPTPTTALGIASRPSANSTSRSLSPSDLSSVSLRPEPEGARATGEHGTKEESLEEISSKLIQSILQAKADLQSQYEQMVELQSDQGDEGVRSDENASQLAVRDLGFSYPPHKMSTEDAVEESEEEVRVLAEKLAAARDAMRQQQTQMRALLTCYVSSQKVRCQECEERRCEGSQLDSLRLWANGEEHTSCSGDGAHVRPQQVTDAHISEVAPPPEIGDTETTADGLAHSPVVPKKLMQSQRGGFVAAQTERELPEGESAPCKKFCPLCSTLYGPERSFDEFHEHVMSHFPDTDDEVTANFVVV